MSIKICFECKKEIEIDIIICPYCGFENKLSNEDKISKFNYLAFLFTPFYYVGYGDLNKAIILFLLLYNPFSGILVAIYGGIYANKELPIGKVPFNWKKVLLFLLVATILHQPLSRLKDKLKNSNYLNTYENRVIKVANLT